MANTTRYRAARRQLRDALGSGYSLKPVAAQIEGICASCHRPARRKIRKAMAARSSIGGHADDGGTWRAMAGLRLRETALITTRWRLP